MDTNLEKEGNKGSTGYRKKSRKKKNKGINVIIGSFIAIIVCVFIGATSYVYTTVKKYDNLIFPGTTVENADIGGMTKENAIKLLNDKYNNQVESRLINIKVENGIHTLGLKDLQVKYNIEETIDMAFKNGRDLGYVGKYNTIKKGTDKEFPINFTYDQQVVNLTVENIATEVNSDKKDADIKKTGNGFSVTDEVVGKKIDVQALINDINNKIATTKEGNIDVEAKMITETPVKTKEILSKVDSKISTFTTTYGTSDGSRGTNIAIGTRTINGMLLMPGDKFSFNTVIGDTTPDKGYQKGGVIVGEEIVDGYGGGICQVSSTLHNAVIKSGILPDQRRNHSMPVGYVQKGLDATISYGGIDYVFTNSTDYPIYIEGVTYDGKVTFSLYSNSALLTGKTYGFTSETYETIQPTTKYVDDPTLEEGKEVVDKRGSQGYKVKAYRIIYQDGREISRELMNNDVYNPSPKVIKKGTKKPEVQTPDPTTPQPPTNPGQTPGQEGNGGENLQQ